MADSSGIIIHVPVLLEASGNLTIFGETLAAEKVNFFDSFHFFTAGGSSSRTMAIKNFQEFNFILNGSIHRRQQLITNGFRINAEFVDV